MNGTNSILLNRFFTRNTFKQIVEDGESPTYIAAVQRYVSDSSEKTNSECIREIYRHLENEYQNEYYYKNTLLNKRVHSLRATTVLTEVAIGNSKADVILINGQAIIYEIKTALDNFDRLDGQIQDYYKAFSKVVVVVSEQRYEEIQQKYNGSTVGICVLTKKGRLSNRQKPIDYREQLSNSIMFKILRKSEYEKILSKYFGFLPKVSQFEYYRECKALFESLPIDVAYRMFIQVLKLRAKIDIIEYEKIPYELKFLAYFINYKKSDYEKLYHFLNK